MGLDIKRQFCKTLSELSGKKLNQGLATGQPSTSLEISQSVVSPRCNLLTTTSTRLVMASMNTQTCLRWVFGSTAPAEAPTAEHPGLCSGPKADELTRLDFASTGTDTDDSAKLVYFFAGVGTDGVDGQRTECAS